MNEDKTFFSITKKTFKVLKYIYKKQDKGCYLEDIWDKFDQEAHTGLLVDMELAFYKLPDGTYSNDSKNESYNYQIFLSLVGTKYVEDKLESRNRWLIPVVTSIISLSISIVSLVISIAT